MQREGACHTSPQVPNPYGWIFHSPFHNTLTGTPRDPQGPTQAAEAGDRSLRPRQRRPAARRRVPNVEGAAATLWGLLLEPDACAGHAQDARSQGSGLLRTTCCE